MKFQANYSIRDLEKLSGIKAHTLRIWEKRYNLLKPERTDTNIRYYTNDDLRQILNVSLLNRHGVKISAIASMGVSEMAERISAISLEKTGADDLIESLIVTMIDMDERRFNDVLDAGIRRMGFERTIQETVFPFFRRIGILWQTGGINPAQEHFVSNLVRQKLIVAIDNLPVVTGDTAPRALLFLPENELHELGLLFYQYALRTRGIRTDYLGQTVPFDSLARIVDITKPRFLVSVVTNPFDEDDLSGLIKKLSRLAGKHGKVLLSGKAVVDRKEKLPANTFLFRDLAGLLQRIS